MGVQGSLFVMLGVVFFAVGASTGHTDELLRHRGIDAQGTILAVSDSKEPSVTITFRTRSGLRETTKDLDAAGALVVGRRVDLVYDQQDPSTVAYADDVADDSDQHGDELVGVLCLVVGGWQTVRAIHHPRPGEAVRTR